MKWDRFQTQRKQCSGECDDDMGPGYRRCRAVWRDCRLFWTIYNPIALVGFAVLIFVTVGAMDYHWRYDSPLKMDVPAMVMFVLSVTLLLLNIR